jgi:SAM-dependent methyltransferase
MISASLLSTVRGPECRGLLRKTKASLVCQSCGRDYGQGAEDFLDLRPVVAFEERTKYIDEALHVDARHEHVSPPLLGSKIRNDMLREFLAPQASDVVADLGCGSGRALVWNRDWGAQTIGVDITPFFAEEARRDVDLLLADLRRLPFADGTFSKAYSLDVLEHLSPESLRGMLKEAARILRPGGRLFVYTHVRKNAPIARGLRWINGLARQLERAGLIDMRQERLRKSDHVNPLMDIPDLHRVAADTGFRVARIRYYTPLVGGFVENILMRMAERQLARRAARKLDGQLDAEAIDKEAVRSARTSAKAQIARSPSTRLVLGALTKAMRLDLFFFGRIQSGPFFALLEKTGANPIPPESGAR